MSDIITTGGGGVIGAAFMLGVQWATKFLKKDGNGNGKDLEIKAREMGVITSDLGHVKHAVDELQEAAIENQRRIGELAGNVETLTKLITKHFKI